MEILLSIAIITTVLFGSIAILFSMREDSKKKGSNSNDEYLHMMIHELRAPLSAIKGASELMIVSEKPLSSEEQIKMSKLIHDQSQKLLDQVSSILDMAKIEAKEFRIQKTPVNLTKLIEDALQVFIPQMNEKHIQLDTSIEENLPIVLVDPLRITQVINNLLSNSIKFTKDNGTITVSVKHLKTPTDHVLLSVADNGIGIPKEKQSQLFSKFYQVNHQFINSYSTVLPTGSGLGLYIVKHIVEAHGGNVSLSSQEEKGTTIAITIPV